MPKRRFYFKYDEIHDEHTLHVRPLLTGRERDKQKLCEQKWEAVEAFLEEHPGLKYEQVHLNGVITCAFCAAYYAKGFCLRCPIYLATGKARCVDTPQSYFEWDYTEDSPLKCSPLKAARAELEFIRSLRKK